MQKITDIFAHQKLTFSFELFPPKTEEGYLKLLNTLHTLCALKPDFISCTYGAGGGSREKTLDIVEQIQNHHHVPSVAHLTCVLNTKNEIKDILTEMKQRGICNVLALRGDAPMDNPNWTPGKNNFKYSWELVAFIREHFKDHFSIGVAGYFPKKERRTTIQMIRDQDMQNAMATAGMNLKTREKISFGFYHTMLMNTSHK